MFGEEEPPYVDAVAAAGALMDKRRRIVAELDGLLIARDRARADLLSARQEVERITGEQQEAEERIGHAAAVSPRRARNSWRTAWPTWRRRPGSR
ncbi:FIG100068: Hypothetical protein [Alloactinosynnema sp. L-07]|nr:FIG100068: Hypothetical protein [Alloactinosynnema sp. L-07]